MKSQNVEGSGALGHVHLQEHVFWQLPYVPTYVRKCDFCLISLKLSLVRMRVFHKVLHCWPSFHQFMRHQSRSIMSFLRPVDVFTVLTSLLFPIHQHYICFPGMFKPQCWTGAGNHHPGSSWAIALSPHPSPSPVLKVSFVTKRLSQRTNQIHEKRLNSFFSWIHPRFCLWLCFIAFSYWQTNIAGHRAVTGAVVDHIQQLHQLPLRFLYYF